MNNNPILLNDPDGDISPMVASGLIGGGLNLGMYTLTNKPENWTAGGAALSFGVGFINGALFGNPFTSYGGALGSQALFGTLPAIVSIDINGGIGAEGAGIGIDITLGIGYGGFNFASVGGGVSVQSGNLVSVGANAELRTSFGIGLTYSSYGAMLGINSYMDSQGTSQMTGFMKFHLGSDKKYLLYEND